QQQVKAASVSRPDDGTVTLGDTLPSETPLPAEIFERQQTRDMVWDALGRLSPEDRSLLAMRYFLELSAREIAEALNCPLGTAKWRLHEARKALRAQLEPVLKD